MGRWMKVACYIESLDLPTAVLISTVATSTCGHEALEMQLV